LYDSSELFKATIANPSELGKPLILIIKLPVDSDAASEIFAINSNEMVNIKMHLLILIFIFPS